MKTTAKLFAILMALVLCVSLAGCGQSAKEKAAGEQAGIEQKINEILSDTPACDGWAPSVVQMINTVFQKYEWEFERKPGTENEYIVKFTGTYSPNPDLPNIAQNGSISYIVNIQSNTAYIYSDPNGLKSTFLVYIVS